MQFLGVVKRCEHNTAASEVMAIGDAVQITETEITVGSHSWTIQVPNQYEGNVIHGSTNQANYLYVICRGTQTIVGLVYPDFGGGDDPGTWEAEEETPPSTSWRIRDVLRAISLRLRGFVKS